MVGRWGGRKGVFGGIGVDAVPVGGGGAADVVAPGVAAERVGEFVLGEVDGLGDGLGEVG